MNIFNFVKWNQFIDGFDRRNILTTLVLLLIFAIDPGRVNAQDYPVKTVRIISPYSAGSGPDVLSRVIAEQLTKIWSHISKFVINYIHECNYGYGKIY